MGGQRRKSYSGLTILMSTMLPIYIYMFELPRHKTVRNHVILADELPASRRSRQPACERRSGGYSGGVSVEEESGVFWGKVCILYPRKSRCVSPGEHSYSTPREGCELPAVIICVVVGCFFFLLFNTRRLNRTGRQSMQKVRSRLPGASASLGSG